VLVDGTFETPFPVSGFSIDGDNWFSDYGSRICNTIFRLDGHAGLVPVGVRVEGPGGTFDTGWDVDADCARMGIARLPAARAGRIAFAASTGAIGKDGTGRLGQPSDVYLADDGGGEATRVEAGVSDPGDVSWLDDTRVLISGERPPGVLGTWIVNTDSGEVQSVLPFSALSVARSPDGTQFAAMRSVRTPTGDMADEIVVFPASLLASN
jgi:hypothetical protein